ncbi:MAG: DNA translocase FtsK [Bryobacteraceae bacterium]|nr:DNA translocase FtsK [Bryobacteraceae bacterium]
MKVRLHSFGARVREAAGIVILAGAVAFICALLSYTPSDPSLNTASGVDRPGNWIGPIGAHLSDLCYQTFGLAAWLIPSIIAIGGWAWFRRREWHSPGVHFAGYALMTVCVAAAASILAPVRPYDGAFEIGGAAGFLISTSLIGILNPVGSLIALATLLILSLYLVSTFSLSSAGDAVESWLAPRLDRLRRRKSEPQPDLVYVPETPAQAMAAAAGAGHGMAFSSPGLTADLEAGYADQPYEPQYEIRDEVFAQDAALALHQASGGYSNGRGSSGYSGGSGNVAVEDDLAPWEDAADPEIPIQELAPEEPAITPPAPEPVKAAKISHSPVPACFQRPPTKLLNPVPDRELYDSDELKEIASSIKAKLEEFNVRGNVVQINPGPVVTTFEFKPDAGVKIAKITTLAEDLCLGLQAESILIERIPGKPTVGIEVPNTRRETISLRQIIESAEFQDAHSHLTIALGKDISGRIRITELDKMPHLLIAGSTGSGKSVMLNALIMSLIYKSTPDEVRMIMVDPKRVELGIYDGIPHLLTPVITEPKKAVNALRNAVLEMERRLKLLASHGVRNIDQFNRKMRQAMDKPLTLFPESDLRVLDEDKPLPYILVVIDELADLMMLERAGVEASVIRLAQMARAVGIHLVLATQRPSVDVITGLIKANFPARISFRVATRVDSRTVLDVMGAEHLLGKGDMLFLPPGSARLVRVHGAFVTENEITEAVDFCRQQAQPDYDESYLIAPPSEDDEDGSCDIVDEVEDPLYVDAVGVVCEMGKASTSILQRRLRLGYGRAARILDRMQREGIIGPPDGSRPRDVLRRPDFLDAPGDESLR